jgi:tRNA threonylcarbamoyladenosine biosynthesis protein TsaB
MTRPRNILAFDTALNGCAAAFYDTELQTGASAVETMSRGQSERLIPMVQSLINEVNKSFQDIDLIVTTVGPGAFTGLRLGMSAARAWGVSLKKPVLGLSTIDALSYSFLQRQEGRPYRVLIETKRTDFYTQLFDAFGCALTPPQALPFDDIYYQRDEVGTVLIGDGAERYLQMYEHALSLRPEGAEKDKALASVPLYVKGFEMVNPTHMARLADSLVASNGLPTEMPQPLYLRGADVSVSKRVQREIEAE